MKPYPQDKSVLILDNCAIHKSDALHEVVEANREFFLKVNTFLTFDRLCAYVSSTLLTRFESN